LEARDSLEAGIPREARESSVDYIRLNPWRAIGISASAALLVGIIVGRSMAA